MEYMLDTNTCIYLIKKNPLKVLKHFKSHTVGDIGLSAITLAELRFGVSRSQHAEKNRQALAAFNEQAAEVYGAVRTALEKSGNPIGALDTLIGAHALSLGVTLVTNDTREFKQIKNLKVVDWSV
jgi:tRNA(fMet)-specific endonuclease VapC